MKKILFILCLSFTYIGFAQLFVSNADELHIADNIPLYTNEEVVNEGTISFAAGKEIDFTLDAGLDNSGGTLNFNDATLVMGSGTANANTTDNFVFNTNDNVKHVVLNKNTGVINVTVGHLGISETLKLESGTLTAGDNVTLLNPNANEHAYVVQSSGGTANLSVEKYYPDKRAFRTVTSPVNGGSIFDNWQQGGLYLGDNGYEANTGTHITGSAGTSRGYDTSTGLDYTISGSPSMFYFNNGWQPVTDTKNTNLETGVPYRLMIRGDREIDLTNNNATPTETTLVSTGDLEVGSKNYTFPTAVGGTTTFAFVANPYQSRIDVNEVLTASANANNVKFWVWDPMVNTRGGFVVIDQLSGVGTATPTSTATKFIEPGQAFFIQLDNANDNISFTESMKDITTELSQTPGPGFGIPNPVRRFNTSLMQVLLELRDDKDKVIDGIRLRFSPNGDNNIDPSDIDKLGNIDENLASVNANSLFTIQQRNLPKQQEQIGLFADNWRSTDYSFTAYLDGFNATKIYLKDNYLNNETLLENGDAYNFSVDASIPESKADDRFALSFDNVTLGVEETKESQFSLYPNPAEDILNIDFNTDAKVDIAIYTLLGQKVVEYPELSSGQQAEVNVSQLQAGVYLLQLTDEKGNTSSKQFIKN